MKPVKDIKGNKKSFYHFSSSKRLNGENARTVLKGVGDLVTIDVQR